MQKAGKEQRIEQCSGTWVEYFTETDNADYSCNVLTDGRIIAGVKATT